ncbi:MAG: hypothetical protein ACI8PD_002190, partial [Nitrospinales bacterium]
SVLSDVFPKSLLPFFFFAILAASRASDEYDLRTCLNYLSFHVKSPILGITLRGGLFGRKL